MSDEHIISCLESAYDPGGYSRQMDDLFSDAHEIRAGVAVNMLLQSSEIRFVRSGDGDIFFGIVFMRVFGTDIFRPVAEDAPIGFSSGPSCREDAFVLDRELEL
jgi:hypothetical protein